jgi:hypothetical protein
LRFKFGLSGLCAATQVPTILLIVDGAEFFPIRLSGFSVSWLPVGAYPGFAPDEPSSQGGAAMQLRST